MFIKNNKINWKELFLEAIEKLKTTALCKKNFTYILFYFIYYSI